MTSGGHFRRAETALDIPTEQKKMQRNNGEPQPPTSALGMGVGIGLCFSGHYMVQESCE